MASSFGGALRLRRTDAGLSLSDLASRTYYSKGYLSKVETGTRGPTEGLARACDAALAAGGTLIGLARDAMPDQRLADPGPDDTMMVGDVLRMVMQACRAADGSAVHTEVRAEALRVAFANLRLMGQQFEPTLVLEMVRPLLVMAAPGQNGFTARCAEFAGWMAQEKGDEAGALRLTHAAWALARRAGDRDLVAHTWVRRAEVALYRRDARAVLDYSGLAQRDSAVSPRVRALGACVEAHGHALTGDARSCGNALGRAETLLGLRRDAADGFTIGSSTVEDLVGVTAGWCDLELGRPSAAAEKLQRAVRRLPAQARRARGLFAARACVAYAAMGEPDLACEVGRAPLHEVRFTRSAVAISQLRVARQSLRRWHRRGTVRDFTADLTDVLYDSTFTNARKAS